MDQELALVVGEALGAPVLDTRPVHGGDFAIAYRVTLGDGRTCFVKTHRNPPPGFFSTEAAGLTWMAQTGTVNIPKVLAQSDSPAFLALEWIEIGRPNAASDSAFGRALAEMHRATAQSFGRSDCRTTGSLALPNDPTESWAEFYATRRLEPLALIAEKRRSLPAGVIYDLRKVAERLPQLVGPNESPTRLHGDLWAGNRIVDTHGQSWLVDPACFGGHREFDLAMMRLFGGFGLEIFDAYDESFPLADGWQERISLHQIAPLVVHAIKFSGGYVAAATEAISKYL